MDGCCGFAASFLLASASPYDLPMGSGLPGTIWVIVALGLMWLGVAIALSILAARRLKLAQGVLGAARSNATLLELTPARPLVVRADLKVEADPQLLRELGLSSSPTRLGDLAGSDSGIEAGDLEELSND